MNRDWILRTELTRMMCEPMIKPVTTTPSYADDLSTHGFSVALLGTQQGCEDHVFGDILSGWRYDLSALSADRSGDFQEHIAECQHCRARQRLHRTIDVALMALFTLSAFAFLVATAIIHRGPWAQLTFAQVHMRHLSMAVTLQSVAVCGVFLSVLMWVLVAIATPAPGLISNTVQQRRALPGRWRDL